MNEIYEFEPKQGQAVWGTAYIGVITHTQEADPCARRDRADTPVLWLPSTGEILVCGTLLFKVLTKQPITRQSITQEMAERGAWMQRSLGH